MGDNPWGGYSLEWMTSSPPPEFNFEEAAGDPQSAAGGGPLTRLRVITL